MIAWDCQHGRAERVQERRCASMLRRTVVVRQVAGGHDELRQSCSTKSRSGSSNARQSLP
jgi:hypothetical protein